MEILAQEYFYADFNKNMISGIQNFTSLEQTPFDTKKSDYFILPETAKDIYKSEQEKKEKLYKKTGIIVSAAALATSAAVFIFTKGLPKNTYKYMEKLNSKIQQRTKRLNKSDYLNRFYKKASQKISSVIEKSKSLNNINSVKDLLFMNIMSLNKVTQKIHSKTTDFFEALARLTVKKQYNRSHKKFAKLTNLLSDTNVKIESNEVRTDISKRICKIKDNLRDGFGYKGQNSRYKEMLSAMQGLDKRVIEESFNGISKTNNLKQNLEKFKESPIRQSFIAEDILAKDKEVLLSKVDNLHMPIKNEIDTLKSIYKEHLSEKDYRKIEKQIKVFEKSLDKAINTENNLFFDKLRDLKLGSAPTDILTVLGSVVGTGIGLLVAKDKDERISAGLKYGIPVIGGLTTSLALTVSLVSGLKSLGIGFASSLLIGIVGDKIDKQRKEFNKLQIDIKHAENIKSEIEAKKP